MSNNDHFGTGGLLGTRMTGYDIGVTADNGVIIYPHAPRTIQHLAGKGIAVYAIAAIATTASASLTINVSGTASAGATYTYMGSVSAPAGSGIWCRTSAEFPA
mgnify:CR=1 FL=1